MALRSCDHCCLKIEDLSVAFGNVVAVDHIDLHTNCNELLAVIGPNGAGKSSLLKALVGEVPHSGSIQFRFQGELRKKYRCGYVPQKLTFDAGSPLSVADLLATTMSWRPVWAGVTRDQEQVIRTVLSTVIAEHLLHRKLGELSGGELQRVLLAMAMTPPPEILLLDEPAAAVDAKGLALFYTIVSELKNNHDVSIIMVTHDIHGIAPFADRMILLNRSILADGKPKDVLAMAATQGILDPAPLPISPSANTIHPSRFDGLK
jgi:zinc transport system ATP-binding protein